jgi:PAS domain-containing protein
MQNNADRNANHIELIVLVRGACDAIEEDSELNIRLHGFAAHLLKRRLIAKVEFLQTTELGRSGIVNPNHNFATNWKLPLRTLDPIISMVENVNKFTEGLIIQLKQIKIPLQRAYRAITKLVRGVADKPRRLRETLQARENDLRNLLATSLDAIVVTDGDRRFIAANSIALHLFGVSQKNITMFTMNAFLRDRHVVELDENGLFKNCKEKHGECEIKSLTGSLLVAEYTFVENVVSQRHLYRFRDVAPYRIAPFNAKATVPCSQRHWPINQFPARVSHG